MTPTEYVFQLFETRGEGAYFGENVTQLEHALQTANLAAETGADDNLVVAALLHDIGHLMHELGEDAAEQGIDSAHERISYEWLLKSFGPEVAEPVRMHVDAKRYLCAVDTAYLEGLSLASRHSLKLQGGPYTSEEVHEFESHPGCAAAIRLRHWDDMAKIPELSVPDLASYRDLLNRVAKISDI